MTQTRLFADEYPQRPGRYEDEISKRAAELLLPAVQRWLGSEADERTLPELIKATRIYDEGYEIARALELRGYSPDAELVEILDGMFLFRLQAHEEAVKNWVKAHDLRLDLAPGAAVSIVVNGKPHIGEIRSRNEATAEYTVMVPTLGHVRDGTGTNGLIVGFEKVTRISQAATVAREKDYQILKNCLRIASVCIIFLFVDSGCRPTKERSSKNAHHQNHLPSPPP
jgi:hypothetical protein